MKKEQFDTNTIAYILFAITVAVTLHIYIFFILSAAKTFHLLPNKVLLSKFDTITIISAAAMWRVILYPSQ